MKITGQEAIDFARTHGLKLSKYADHVEAEREGLSVEHAMAVAFFDAALIYVEVDGPLWSDYVKSANSLEQLLTRLEEMEQADAAVDDGGPKPSDNVDTSSLPTFGPAPADTEGIFSFDGESLLRHDSRGWHLEDRTDYAVLASAELRRIGMAVPGEGGCVAVDGDSEGMVVVADEGYSVEVRGEELLEILRALPADLEKTFADTPEMTAAEAAYEHFWAQLPDDDYEERGRFVVQNQITREVLVDAERSTARVAVALLELKEGRPVRGDDLLINEMRLDSRGNERWRDVPLAEAMPR